MVCTNLNGNHENAFLRLFFNILFFSSAGGWVKTKLELTTLPRTVSCVGLTRLYSSEQRYCCGILKREYVEPPRSSGWSIRCGGDSHPERENLRVVSGLCEAHPLTKHGLRRLPAASPTRLA